MAILRYLTLLSVIAFGDIAIEPLAVVKHYDSEGKNENAKYFGLVYRYDNFDVGIASYENSHYTRTTAGYVGYRLPVWEDDKWIVGLFVQAGYRTNYNQKFIAYGGPYVEYDNFYAKVNVNTEFTGLVVGYIIRF